MCEQQRMSTASIDVPVKTAAPIAVAPYRTTAATSLQIEGASTTAETPTMKQNNVPSFKLSPPPPLLHVVTPGMADNIAITVANNSANNNSSDVAMGQCYPKCMTDAIDASSRMAPPGVRAKRQSKPQHSLHTLKALRTSDNNNVIDGDIDLSTLDVEELGTDRSKSATLLASSAITASPRRQPPASIVVDYEDAHDASPPRTRARQNSLSDCARDACRPLGDDNEEEDAGNNNTNNRFDHPLSVSDLKSAIALASASAPTTPGSSSSRRRSANHRQSTGILDGCTGIYTGISATPPIEFTSKHLQTTESPTTDTDTSVDDVSSSTTIIRCTTQPKLCLCEVQLHATHTSCWLVSNALVYDVTGILDVHPGGPRSILRKAGGADCTRDMQFHTKNARRMLDQCFIGKLQPCGDVPERQDGNCSIM